MRTLLIAVLFMVLAVPVYAVPVEYDSTAGTTITKAAFDQVGDSIVAWADEHDTRMVRSINYNHESQGMSIKIRVRIQTSDFINAVGRANTFISELNGYHGTEFDAVQVSDIKL